MLHFELLAHTLDADFLILKTKTSKPQVHNTALHSQQIYQWTTVAVAAPPLKMNQKYTYVPIQN